MNKPTAALLALSLFAIACGSSPAASTHDEVNSARQALEEGEDSEPVTVETATAEADEPTPLALVAGDAGAPEAPEAAPEAPVGDAGAPPGEDEGPAPVCTEGATQCAEQGVETCVDNAWTPSSTCEFWCTEGACNTCSPGDSFGEIGMVYICDPNGQLRQWERPDLTAYPLNLGPASEYPEALSLPLASNPPRWIRVVGSQWAQTQQ